LSVSRNTEAEALSSVGVYRKRLPHDKHRKVVVVFLFIYLVVFLYLLMT